ADFAERAAIQNATEHSIEAIGVDGRGPAREAESEACRKARQRLDGAATQIELVVGGSRGKRIGDVDLQRASVEIVSPRAHAEADLPRIQRHSATRLGENA